MPDVVHPATIKTAAPEGRLETLRLVFGHVSEPDRTALVRNLIDMPRVEDRSLGGLFAARRDRRLAGGIWAQLQTGATAVVWPAQLVGEEPEATAAALTEAAVGFLRSSGVRMAQSLLPSPDAPAGRILEAAGFSFLTNLEYLVSFEARLPHERPPVGLEFDPYGEQDHGRFATILEQTYQDTLDCPRLNGVRRIDDVLAGYRSTGVFDPARWLIVRHHGQDVGCLLLADHPAALQWELVYMGLVPEARGQGLGVHIARYAQWLTRQAGRPRLVLAVDAANQPAQQMYARAGFVVWDHRSVFLQIFEA